MKVLNGLAFLITLLVAALTWALYLLEPGLLIGTPWGPLHVAFALLGAFVLGLGVTGLYVLTGWVNAQTALSKRNRELRQVRSELEALKKQHPEETPVIPDRIP
ncbi:LapA family protein [Meiothermus sp.]|jgi:UDP-N-acetylmuramyl pentapeptide phosphotransferase/UDP-N-acetylglucosamine-1-phosphate transferase|uniref:LapA family protein n=1 Tax=Meiothermus sp. TaxID=1955249 RepID=UPI0026299048|nr:LapA family protein [Meiothermus sp.]